MYRHRDWALFYYYFSPPGGCKRTKKLGAATRLKKKKCSPLRVQRLVRVQHQIEERRKERFFLCGDLWRNVCTAARNDDSRGTTSHACFVISFFFLHFFFFSLPWFLLFHSQPSRRTTFFFHVHLWLSSGREVARPFNYWPVLDGSFWGTEKKFFFLFLWLKHSTHNTIGVIDSVALFRPKSRPERSTQVVVGYTRGPIEENGPGVLLASRFFFFFDPPVQIKKKKTTRRASETDNANTFPHLMACCCCCYYYYKTTTNPLCVYYYDTTHTHTHSDGTIKYSNQFSAIVKMGKEKEKWIPFCFSFL